MLAKANRLEEIASELDGQQSRFQASVEAQNGAPEPAPPPLGPRCHCGWLLKFERTDWQRDLAALLKDPEGHAQFVCWCARCKLHALQDGSVVHVYGHGRDESSALADWRMKRDSF